MGAVIQPSPVVCPTGVAGQNLFPEANHTVVEPSALVGAAGAEVMLRQGTASVAKLGKVPVSVWKLGDELVKDGERPDELLFHLLWRTCAAQKLRQPTVTKA